MKVPCIMLEEHDPFEQTETNDCSAKYDHNNRKEVNEAVIGAIIILILETANSGSKFRV